MKPATTVNVVRRFFASGVQPAGTRQATEVVDPGCFGPLLRHARLQAGLSQEALAERARLSWRTISDLERRVKQTPHFETVALLAEALRLPEVERAAFVASARPQRVHLGALPGLARKIPIDQRVRIHVRRTAAHNDRRRGLTDQPAGY